MGLPAFKRALATFRWAYLPSNGPWPLSGGPTCLQMGLGHFQVGLPAFKRALATFRWAYLPSNGPWPLSGGPTVPPFKWSLATFRWACCMHAQSPNRPAHLYSYIALSSNHRALLTLRLLPSRTPLCPAEGSLAWPGQCVGFWWQGI